MSKNKENILSNAQHDALINGAVVLIDDLYTDYIRISKGEAIDDSMVLADCLPRQFRHRYTELFVKKFIVCVIRVADRLAVWDGGTIPASTAECMALMAIIEQAKMWLEMKGEENGRYQEADFSLFEDDAFPDLDAHLLFDLGLDGIENTQMAKQMGMALKPSEWFKPIYFAPVHPYVCE